MSKPLWHTINIQIPDKMINISKNGRMSIKPSLTKKGNVSRSNNEPSIIIKSNSTIDKPIIKDSGQLENVEAIKARQKKLKTIKDKLTNLPNKAKITKAEFVAKVKAKVAPNLNRIDELNREFMDIKHEYPIRGEHNQGRSGTSSRPALQAKFNKVKSEYEKLTHTKYKYDITEKIADAKEKRAYDKAIKEKDEALNRDIKRQREEELKNPYPNRTKGMIRPKKSKMHIMK